MNKIKLLSLVFIISFFQCDLILQDDGSDIALLDTLSIEKQQRLINFINPIPKGVGYSPLLNRVEPFIFQLYNKVSKLTYLEGNVSTNKYNWFYEKMLSEPQNIANKSVYLFDDEGNRKITEQDTTIDKKSPEYILEHGIIELDSNVVVETTKYNDNEDFPNLGQSINIKYLDGIHRS